MDKKFMVYKPFQVFKGELIPSGANVDCDRDGRIFYCGQFLCLQHSAHSHECLVGNDDGYGKERGSLIDEIYNLIWNEQDFEKRTDRVTALWNDDTAKKYVRYNDPSNPWLWDDSYFCAEIEDLEHIKDIIINAPNEEEERSEENAN